MSRTWYEDHSDGHQRCACTGQPDDEGSGAGGPVVRAPTQDNHRHGGEETAAGPVVGRRHVLAGGAAAAAGLAGCSLSGSGEAPEPIALTAEYQCDVCGMVIPNHPGPVAQIFYADEEPSDHDNPARFCSAWEAFQYNFERQDRGWSVSAFYVTDYSAVDYEIKESGGDTLISSHPDADAFVAAEDVTFVVGSEVKGAMGQDLIPFSDRGDAESFQEKYDGQLAGFDGVTRETVDQLGMA
jgi:copper chaperone NosL